MSIVRFAELADLPRIVEIYNQAIRSHGVTGDTIPFMLEERQGWFDQRSRETNPLYVYENDAGAVMGFLSLSSYRDRPAMQRTAEVSYYVDYACHHQGIGQALLEHALADCPRIGKHVLLAIVLEWNTPSLRLLEKLGFEKWGYLPEIAEFSGQLCGHLYYGLKIV